MASISAGAVGTGTGPAPTGNVASGKRPRRGWIVLACVGLGSLVYALSGHQWRSTGPTPNAVGISQQDSPERRINTWGHIELPSEPPPSAIVEHNSHPEPDVPQEAERSPGETSLDRPHRHVTSVQRLRLGQEGRARRRVRQPPAQPRSKSGATVHLGRTGVMWRPSGPIPTATHDAKSDLPTPSLPGRDEIATVMTSARERIQQCYDRKMLPGSVVVTLEVSGISGRVKSATTSADSAIAECIKRVLRELTFPQFSRTTATIRYPYDFR